MNLFIKPLEAQDAAALLDFERRNRAFFEQSVPSRGEAYYDPDTFQVRHQALLDEQEQGLSHFYLIWNDAGQIVGRVNLVDIDPTGSEGELGFRVGKEFTGKGIGHHAVALLLAKEPDIKRIKAKTTITNYASQKVLENNGFEQVAINEEAVGEPVTFIYYILEI